MTHKNKSIIIYQLTIYRFIKFCFDVIYVILFIVIYISNMHPICNVSNNKLAFNINIVYVDKIKCNYKTIKSIEFERCNRILYKQIIHKYSNCFYATIRSYHKILKIINAFQMSGLTNNIRYYLVTSKKNKYSIINCSTHPLIKKIVVLNSPKLRIPKHLLYRHLLRLLGLPRNYQELSCIIKTVNTWYKRKGFNHVNIEPIDNDNKNFLILRIQEGIIIKTSLECESKLNLSKSYLQYIENRIIKELNILIGNIVNTKKIDIGIKKLKEEKIISNCKYKIIYSHSGITINLSYHLYAEYINYIKGKHINLNIHYFDENNDLVCKYYNSVIKFISIILLKQIRLHQIIRELQKHLYFVYSQLYIKNHNYKHYIFDITRFKNNPIFNIRISFPSIYIHNNLVGNFLISAYKNEILLKVIYPINNIAIQNTHILNQYGCNIESASNNIGLKFQHSLFDYIDLHENISLLYNRICKNIINIQRQKIYSIFRVKENLPLYLFKKLKQNIKQILIKLDIYIKYNNFHLIHKIEQGTSFIIKIKSLTCLRLQKCHTVNLEKSFNQELKIQYHKIIMLPKVMNSIKSHNNAIILSTKVYTQIHGANYVNNLFKLNPIYNKHYMYNMRYCFPSILYVYNLEYHMFLDQYYSLYIFFSYMNNFNNTRSDVLNHYLYSYLLNEQFNYETNIGYGIQFNIPIRHIPPLRIEYCISNKSEKFLQLRLYSKHKEYHL